ncbi:unnamed protein product [Orchesella dallaii]|uniref:PID domain-containing protein n=1 Tax=Orchesella dallaii TaxID=48710 RepID=A0ABP1Q263_9HEXA
MSSLLDHLDSNQSENDDIHLLFPKCKPRASSVGTESQSSESQSNSQQYLADNFRDQNLNHPSGGSRQSSRRHSSGFTHQQQHQHHNHQQHQQQHQQLPDNLLKHSKHSSYPPLLTTASSPTSTSTNSTATFIGHPQLSPYDNNNVAHDIGTSTNNKFSDTSSLSHHHHQSRSQNNHHHNHQHHQHHQNLQSDSSDNFPLTPSFSSNYVGNSSGSGSNKKIEGHHHHPHHHHNTHHHNHHSSSNSSSIKTHHHSHSRSKNSISSRNSRHEIASALPSGGSGGGGSGGGINCQNQSSTRHHHNNHRSSHSTSDRPHRSKKLHMTESSSCEPISPAVNKSSRYKSQKSSSEAGPTKSYSTLSLGSGMECDHLDDRYDDGFCRGGRTNLTSNGASYGEHSRASNMPGNGGCLRDSRIEIAGGREIYSQNRIRAGRRLRGSSSTSSSTEMMADSSISITASSSSSAGTKARRKSPNVQVQQQQHHHHHQQPQQQTPSQHSLLCTNGDDGSELSVWEPKHSNPVKSYQQENVVVGSRSHHSSSHRHHGSQHHHHHHHNQSHARSRHVCGYPHCDHAKVLSPTDLSPACGSTYKSSGPAIAPSHNSSSSANNTPMTVKETVFSTEITSIEKPIEPENSKQNLRQTSTSMQPPYVYETNVSEPGGEIIFDDIGNWGRNGGAGGGGGSSGGAEAGLCIERPRKESMKRSPSGRNNARPAQLNFFHSVMSENEGGMHCCGEQMNHSGSGMKDNTPTVLLQRSPSPSTRGGNTTPSGYESDEYSGVTPVSLNMMACSSSKACLTNNRLIGALPIAEYEGSPKRYGLRQPTHPMPTHLDLVDVDMQMDVSGGGGGGNGSLRSNSEMNSSSAHHVSISLMSPSQSKLPAVPTTASSSSSSSLDNTNSNASSTSSNRNLYGSRISPRVLSPSQSVSNFPARVPGFPQRITPVTSSLDSSSLVDSGLEKSEATDTKGDNLLDGDIGTSQSSGNNDECPTDHHHHHHHHILHQSNTPPQTHHQQDSSHMILGTDNEELGATSSSGILCQGQLITSDHSSDLLLTDQLNMKPEKSNPSGTSNLSLDGSDSHHLQQNNSHHMVLDLDRGGGEDHHQSHSQQQSIHLPCSGSVTGTTREDGASHNTGDINDDQCLISVPSSSSDVVHLGESISADGHNLLGAATSSEYLYEFSETRKVLEEFFGSAAATGIGGGGIGASSVATNSATGVVVGLDENIMSHLHGPFDELDYTLRRQAGNSYVGQRLAGDSCTVEESPKKPARRGVLLLGSSDGDGGEGEASPRLISFQEITLPQIQHQQQQKSAQNPPRDLNDNDIDGDSSSTNTETDNLGDTEVGLQVGLSRNFTLSPETTDCDSNELESEISLDYEASLHSSSRVGVSMPAVEDGLSSGNVSDTEDTVPSSDQLNNDLKRTQQSLLCSTTNTGSSNNSSNGRQLSSIGVQKGREPQQLQQNTSGQLIEDGLGRNGVSGVSQQQLGLLSSSSTTSICSTTANPTACVNSLPQQQQQQSSQTSPANTSSSSNTKIPSDPNPTLLLMKKQISEIEKEIKMRASQQNQKMQHSVDSNSSGAASSGSNSNCSHNPIMSAATTDEVGVGVGVGSGNISTSTMNGNGNSCVANGNGPSGGLASQLNVSSCPDVSTLSNSSGQGSTSCYPQQPVATSTAANTNNNSSHHRTGDNTTLPLVSSSSLQNSTSPLDKGQETTNFDSIDIELEALDPMRPTPPPSPAPSSLCQPQTGAAPGCATNRSSGTSSCGGTKAATAAAVPINIPTVAGSANRVPESTSVISPDSSSSSSSVAAAIQDIKEAIQRTKTLPRQQPSSSHVETSRPSPLTSSQSHADAHNSDTSPVWVPRQGTSSYHHHRSGGGVKDPLLRKQRYDETPDDDADTDQETDRLLGQTRTEDDYGFYDEKEKDGIKKKRSKEVLIEGVLFRARYLGSTQLVCEGQPTKATRMLQAEEAVSRIKAPEGETQPSTEVDLFISTEKIMVLNTDLKEIMMDHALRTISYIADIGDLVVLMARRRPVPSDTPEDSKLARPPKMICHVFESDEAQYIAQSIGQAFQVAYMEFLKANGIEDQSFVREMDYQEVLNSQEIFGDELQMFAKKELQKEVVVPKSKGEILGVVIVESGWGSMLPTVVIANLAPAGAAARCGQLNIGDQIIAINGVSLVGLPLSTCQNYIKNTKSQTVVKLTVVPCPPVVEVKIKRPDTKYQLGFSVQNGVICSLLRGGIAERGGVRVGHRIIEINGQSVVAVPHEKIVNLLATSVGEINMKTMPTSMFRLLTGQETPLYI